MKDKPVYPDPSLVNEEKYYDEKRDVFVTKNKGITLREHYAGLAMQGLLSGWYDTYDGKKEVAKLSVKMADALIKELKK